MNKTSVAAQLNRLDIDRLRGYKELLDFYHGRQWEGRERWGEKRLTFNYTKVFIDKLTSYLMSGINFAVDAVEDSDEARAKARRAEAALRQVYEDNNLEQLDLETEIDGAILGDACYKVIWDGEAKRVRVTAPDVQGIYAWWLGDDTSRMWRVASKYSLSAEESELLYQLKPKGKTATVVELWTDAEFELYLDDGLVEKSLIPMALSPLLSTPTSGSRRGSGVYLTWRRLWSRSGSLTGRCHSYRGYWSYRAIPSPSWRMLKRLRMLPSNQGRCGLSPRMPRPISLTCCRVAG
jgi:hypothetical protein